MDFDALCFFDKMPQVIPLYEAFAERVRAVCGEVTVRVQKTQISFSNKHNFAAVSLPIRRVKGWPEICIIVTFGLEYRVSHPRIAVSTEPYPNRWTHHVIVENETDIDDLLIGWVKEAYDFSMNKQRRR